MKKSKFFIAFFVLIVCSSSYAKDINITGTYKFKPCNILIKISKKDSGNKTKYYYTITENNQTKSKGYMPDIIRNSEGEFYVKFKNFQAAYENDTLVIQNYGNSMNQYMHFKDCDIKFLEFEKEQQK